MAKHKHYEAIVAWAEGKTIQVASSHGENWATITRPEWMVDLRYRVKPETLKYRRWLAQFTFSEPSYRVLVCHEGNIHTPEMIEKDNSFIRWIDTDWIEAEI